MATALAPDWPDLRAGKHLSERQVAAFIDGRLAPAERAIAESHLAECDSCRSEFRDAARLVASLPEPRRQARAWRWVGVAAAAAALLIVLLPRARTPFDSGDPVERRATADMAAAVTVVQPREGAVVESDRVEFIWRRDDDASYRLTVTDSAGGTIWSTTTADTTLVVPPDLRLPTGGLLHWYVDALRLDGTAASSGPVAFRTH